MEIIGTPPPPFRMGAVHPDQVRLIAVDTLRRAAAAAEAQARTGAPGWEEHMRVRDWLWEYARDVEQGSA